MSLLSSNKNSFINGNIVHINIYMNLSIAHHIKENSLVSSQCCPT